MDRRSDTDSTGPPVGPSAPPLGVPQVPSALLWSVPQAPSARPLECPPGPQCSSFAFSFLIVLPYDIMYQPWMKFALEDSVA
ncbi:hypothetical protein STEG23_002327 [Scotinomys teguina]